jgi:hypothetical protein
MAKLKTKIFADHSDSVRFSRWSLIQQDDGTLHVEQEAKYADGNTKRRLLPMNQFMLENGPPPRALQKLIDRMFDDDYEAPQ